MIRAPSGDEDKDVHRSSSYFYCTKRSRPDVFGFSSSLRQFMNFMTRDTSGGTFVRTACERLFIQDFKLINVSGQTAPDGKDSFEDQTRCVGFN